MEAEGATQTSDVEVIYNIYVKRNAANRCAYCNGELKTGYPIHFAADLRFCTIFCRTTSDSVVKHSLSLNGISL